MSSISPSSPDLSSFTNSNKIITIQTINDVVLPALLDHLSKAKSSIQTLPNPNDNSNSNTLVLFDKLRQDLDYVKDAFEKLKRFEDHASVQIRALVLQSLSVAFDDGDSEGIHTKLRELNDVVTKLKLHIPSSTYMISSANSDAHRSMRSTNRKGPGAPTSSDGWPNLNLHTNEKFRRSSAFKDFQVLYEGLGIELRLCLLCFAVFPENVVVKKRLLSYWWIGEGFIDPPLSTTAGEKAAEEIACEFFRELMAKGLIEPVNKKRSPASDSCKMHPFVRSAVIALAERAKFFNFDSKGNARAADFSWSCRACLLKTEEGSSQQELANSLNQEKLQLLFNVNEHYLDFKLDWFSKMKNVTVLHLGRWQSSAMHHIEVEDVEFLKGLKSMRHLRFFSLQGISRIMELPDTISKLTNLRILGLRACHNLEVLSDGIASLKNLTHLDMSECYLLDHMPKGLASLSELQVLKGFVIGDPKSLNSCTLDDLVGLGELRKLSINTSRETFPTEKDLNTFQNFGALRKLTIAWGGGSLQAKPDSSAKQENVVVKSTVADTTDTDNRGHNIKQDNGATKPETAAAMKRLRRLPAFKREKVTDPVILPLPVGLEKLDLQCFPLTTAPSWLMPTKLENLKKLYIRGGKLQDLGQGQKVNDKCAVEILRVKFLSELEMDWRELQALFPALIYLEKVKCPKLTFFPCDESGVWMKRTMNQIS